MSSSVPPRTHVTNPRPRRTAHFGLGSKNRSPSPDCILSLRAGGCVLVRYAVHPIRPR